MEDEISIDLLRGFLTFDRPKMLTLESLIPCEG